MGNIVIIVFPRVAGSKDIRWDAGNISVQATGRRFLDAAAALGICVRRSFRRSVGDRRSPARRLFGFRCESEYFPVPRRGDARRNYGCSRAGFRRTAARRACVGHWPKAPDRVRRITPCAPSLLHQDGAHGVTRPAVLRFWPLHGESPRRLRPDSLNPATGFESHGNSADACGKPRAPWS